MKRLGILSHRCSSCAATWFTVYVPFLTACPNNAVTLGNSSLAGERIKVQLLVFTGEQQRMQTVLFGSLYCFLFNVLFRQGVAGL